MAIEHLDVLAGPDPDADVVDQVPRPRVHAEGLWHRSVHCFVFDPDGRLYLQKRAETKDLYPGVWTSSASGHPEPGEGWQAAMQRELEEELGIVARLEPVGSFVYDGGDDREVSRLWETTWDGPVDPDRREIQDGRWVEMADLETELEQAPGGFAPSFHEAFACYVGRADGPAP